MDTLPPSDTAGHPEPAPPTPPAYVYSAADIRPRQPREIELCEAASRFDWLYTSAFGAGVIGSVLLNAEYLKQGEEPGLRMIGPGTIGFFWGGFLSGGYLSLPKCDPLWAYGAPPEGDVRASWPAAVAITMIAGATAPALDYVFVGPIRPEWTTPERTGRVFVAMGSAVIGSLVPYLLPPRPWAAKKEIERIRLGTAPTQGFGPFVSYALTF